MNDKSKYRCETCNRRIGLPEGTDDCPIGMPSHCDDPRIYTIEEAGCASHSSIGLIIHSGSWSAIVEELYRD